MISVIIPALDEQAAIAATLRAAARESEVGEIILVDGGSIDGTLEVARATALGPRLRIITALRGRAAQMNAGARIATGEWLLFLHADTLLPAGAGAAIVRVDGGFGGFRQQFDVRDWRLRLVSALHNFRCRRSGVLYGDQAMFVRRALFESMGGFPQVAHLEDVMLSERLLERGAPALLPLAVVTSARKFMHAGIWRSFVRCLGIIATYRWGPPGAVAGPARRFFEDIR